MTSLRMALTELRRISSGRAPRLALLALALIPTLYGGLYLYANHDPYGALKNVPAALVVLDSGATDADGKPVKAGADVADELLKGNSFDWHEVSEATARDGVHEGRYDFALTIPRDFSAALTSSARFTPRQAKLEMTTNDANSYLSTTIADQVTVKVRDALAQRVGTEAATNFLLGLSQVRGSLVTAADGAQQLTEGLTTAQSGGQQVASGAGRLSTGATELAGSLDTIATSASALPSQTRRLADGARQVADGNRRVANTADTVGNVSTRLSDDYAARRSDLIGRMQALGLDANQRDQLLRIYDRLDQPIRDANSQVQQTVRDLDNLAGGARQVADGNATLAADIPDLVDGISQARDGAEKLATGATGVKAGGAQLNTGLARLHDGSAQLSKGLQAGVDQIPAVSDSTRNRVAATIGNPVEISSAAQTRASSYGAGLAPFFMALAAWIGGYVLFLLVRPLSSRAMAANQSPLRVAIAGWITPALIGVAQMTALLGVVLLAIRIVPADTAGTWGFMLLMTATFIAIVHALNAWLGSAGQFLGLVLMVLQLVTAGGTFPWQTIPTPLHWLHQVLPMSYAVDGLRQLMYGGLDSLVIRDALVLVAWLVAAIVATSLAARKQRVWSVKRIKPELAI